MFNFIFNKKKGHLSCGLNIGYWDIKAHDPLQEV